MTQTSLKQDLRAVSRPSTGAGLVQLLEEGDALRHELFTSYQGPLVKQGVIAPKRGDCPAWVLVDAVFHDLRVGFWLKLVGEPASCQTIQHCLRPSTGLGLAVRC